MHMEKERAQDLEKVGFGISFMFGIYWTYSIFIKIKPDFMPGIKAALGLLLLYGVGLLLFRSSVKSIPDSAIKKGKATNKELGICFLLQFTALMILSLLISLSSKMTGQEMKNDLEMLSPYMLFLLIVFNPIVEEFVFRKLFAKKLLQHGELFYVLVSSICFAVVHGVALGIWHTIYTFLLGLIWSYLFVKTGSLKIPILFHSLSNLFGGVFPQILMKHFSPEFLMAYSVLINFLAVIGLASLIRNRKNIVLDNKNKLFDTILLKEILSNKGMIFYFLLVLTMMIAKTILT